MNLGKNLPPTKLNRSFKKASREAEKMAQWTKPLPNTCYKEQSLDPQEEVKLSTSVHTCNPRDAVGGARGCQAETGESLNLVGSRLDARSNKQGRLCLETKGKVKPALEIDLLPPYVLRER